MDISRDEQRVLHLLAQGGWLTLERNEKGRVRQIDCFTRDGWRASACELRRFRKLRRLKAIHSRGGGPYRITRRGLELVRAQLDNR